MMAATNRLMRPIYRMGYSSLASQKASNPWGVAGKDGESWSRPRKEDPKGRNMQWVFLGSPGVGKGTYASRLSRLLGIPHIATGDLLREELAQSGPSANEVTHPPRSGWTSLTHPPTSSKALVDKVPQCNTEGPHSPKKFHILASIVNQGKLVPDDIIVNLLSMHLEKNALKGESGFILDGFPRTTRQAEILEHVTEIDLVINLRIREDVLLQKCLGRRICSQCGNNYNVASINIEAKDGHPAIYMAPLLPAPSCISKLITRADDTEEVVKERLRVYHDKSRPVEEFYCSRGKLLEFELPGGIPESWPKLLAALNIEEHDSKQRLAA